MQKSIRPFRFIYSIPCKLCICRAYRLLAVQTLCIFPCFPLISRNEGNFLFSADYLIRQPCGNTLRFPCSASINVHCGADSACPKSSCTFFGAAPLESRSVAEPYSREIAERERKVKETRRPAKKKERYAPPETVTGRGQFPCLAGFHTFTDRKTPCEILLC